jgi:hypothetical protein
MKRMLNIVFFAFCLLGLVGAARAQGQPAAAGATAAPVKDADGYEKVNGDMMQPGESIPAARLVGAAYGFIFAAVAVWVLTVARRTARLEDEVESLRKKLESHG